LRFNAFDREGREGIAKVVEENSPRVLAATPAPPALRKERIGKETACRDGPAWTIPFHCLEI